MLRCRSGDWKYLQPRVHEIARADPCVAVGILGADRAKGVAIDDSEEDEVAPGEGSTSGDSSGSPASGSSPDGRTQSAQASDENPWNLSPERQKKAKENFDKITKGEVQALDRRQKTTVLMSLWRPAKELTGAQRKVVAEIFRTTDFGTEFKEQEAAKRAEFVDRFKRDPVILKVDPRKWSSVSNAEKLAIFDRILGMQAEVYGFPKPKVELRDLGGKEGARGRFDEKTETVQINPNSLSFPAQMATTLGVVAHEGLHARDLKLKVDFAANDIESKDPRFRAAELLSLNMGDMEFPGTAGDIYKNQPAERLARPMNTPIRNIITKRLNERSGVGPPR